MPWPGGDVDSFGVANQLYCQVDIQLIAVAPFRMDKPLPPELLDLIAERFRALGEPARLHILNVLMAGERTVSDLVEDTGLGQANVSKHLQLLRRLGYVERRKEGLYVKYRLADPGVSRLCDIMCGRIEREAQSRAELLTPSS